MSDLFIQEREKESISESKEKEREAFSRLCYMRNFSSNILNELVVREIPPPNTQTDLKLNQ